jgi:hypothetical protein
LKWWRWKCSRINSSQSWIGFKWNQWKWFTFEKTRWPKNFNIPWNFNRLKGWRWKCLRFDSSQSRLWFECDYLSVSIFIQGFCCQNCNWSRNPHPRRTTILRVKN